MFFRLMICSVVFCCFSFVNASETTSPQKMKSLFDDELLSSDTVDLSPFVSLGVSRGFNLNQKVLTGVMGDFRIGISNRMSWRSSTAAYLFINPASINLESGFGNFLEAGIASESMFYFLKWGSGNSIMKSFNLNDYPRYEEYMHGCRFVVGAKVAPFKKFGIDYEYQKVYLDDDCFNQHYGLTGLMTALLPMISYLTDDMATKCTMKSDCFFMPLSMKAANVLFLAMLWDSVADDASKFDQMYRHSITVSLYF